MAQLVEWSLPITEVRSSYPVIGKIYIEHFLLVYYKCIEKTQINKKQPRMAHFFNIVARVLMNLTRLTRNQK